MSRVSLIFRRYADHTSFAASFRFFLFTITLYHCVYGCMFCMLQLNFCKLCIFIVMFLYGCCYLRSMLGILFHCVVLCIVSVYMCTALLPPGVNPIDLTNISYHTMGYRNIIIIVLIINFYTNKADSGAARSEAWVCSCSFVGIAGSYPTAVAMRFVSCECRVLSGRGPCFGLITPRE
jgi:hypothetical protein